MALRFAKTLSTHLLMNLTVRDEMTPLELQALTNFSIAPGVNGRGRRKGIGEAKHGTPNCH